MSRRARRRVRRVRGTMLGRGLMAIWVVLPLLPVVGVLCSWWLGIR